MYTQTCNHRNAQTWDVYRYAAPALVTKVNRKQAGFALFTITRVQSILAGREAGAGAA